MKKSYSGKGLKFTSFLTLAQFGPPSCCEVLTLLNILPVPRTTALSVSSSVHSDHDVHEPQLQHDGPVHSSAVSILPVQAVPSGSFIRVRVPFLIPLPQVTLQDVQVHSLHSQTR